MNIPNPIRRKNLRIKEFDYSLPGAFFITIVAQGRANLFGSIFNEDVYLFPAGEMIPTWWLKIEEKFPGVYPNEFIVMPNHFHGIIVKEWDNSDGITLGEVVQWFKTMTTNEYIRGVKHKNWQPFDKRLWQRNYYEHIIHSLKDYEAIAAYIRSNPLNWDKDEERG